MSLGYALGLDWTNVFFMVHLSCSFFVCLGYINSIKSDDVRWRKKNGGGV